MGQFEYAYSLNQLVYTGSVEYTDNIGVIDSVFRGGRWMCAIYLEEANVIDDQPKGESNKLQLMFMVDTISVLERGQQTVRYRINLVSANIEQCMTNIAFSNYGKDPQPCLDILKACIVASGQVADATAFDAVKSAVSINYISNVNSNLFDISRHLFERMYSYEEKEKSLIFINYDFVNTCSYCLFDIARPELTVNGLRTVVISHQQSAAEGTQPDPVDIGSRMDVSHVDQIKTFREKRLWNYDFESNAFKQSQIDCVRLNNIYSSMPDSVNAQFNQFRLITEDKVMEYGSYWNNSLDVYEQLNSNFGARSIILETTGLVQCRPGCAVTIVQDKIANVSFEDSPKNAEKDTSRYAGFEGLWYVQRVHGYVNV